MASTVPAELKHVSPWLNRASELKAADPVISYWCTYHAAQLGMSAKPSQPASTTFLFGLLDQLEAMRKKLGDNDAVTDEAAGSAYVENFALKVFTGADAEDRAGKATRATATRFLAAVNFLELLSNFGALDEETQAKIKYARWKAADIGKALREGRTPVPGPAGGLEGAAPPSESDAAAAEVFEVERQLLGGNVDGTADSLGRSAAPDVPIRNGSTPAQPPTWSSAPAEPSFGEPSFGDPSTPSETLSPSHPPSHSDAMDFPAMPTASTPTAALPLPTHVKGPRAQPPTSAFPSAVLPSAPPLIPPDAVPALRASPVATVAPERPVGSPAVDWVKVGEAQKHARWAISALNFDDLSTARKELQTALSLIAPSAP